MKYQFHVKLTEKDYYEFNEFHMLKSKQGRKNILTMRTVFAVLPLIIAAVSFWGGGFTLESFLHVIPYLLIIVLFQILTVPMVRGSIKYSIKNMKKSGKMAFSPQSVIEFYDDRFVESTDVNKTEQIYAAIQRVCVIENKSIYIFVNSISGYIIPAACFKDRPQLDEFVEFIKTKSPAVEFYK